MFVVSLYFSAFAQLKPTLRCKDMKNPRNAKTFREFFQKQNSWRQVYLYAKHNLSPEEVAYIEGLIKPME